MNVNMRFSLVLLVGLLCQAIVVPLIAIGPVKPDIILIIITVFGFLDGPSRGAIGGFIGGLLQDMLAVRNVGLSALVKTIIGYFSGRVERTILGNSAIMPVIAIGGASITSQSLYTGLTFIMGEPIDFLITMRWIILPSAAYTALIGLIVFPYLTSLLSAQRQAAVFK